MEDNNEESEIPCIDIRYHYNAACRCGKNFFAGENSFWSCCYYLSPPYYNHACFCHCVSPVVSGETVEGDYREVKDR